MKRIPLSTVRTLAPAITWSNPLHVTRRYRSVMAAHGSVVPAPEIPVQIPTDAHDLHKASIGSLARGLAIYSALSFPSFVDASPTILKITTSIPVVRQVAFAVVRQTFFKHFVGGETFEGTIPSIKSLRERNIASLLEYSVEADEAESKAGGHQRQGATMQYQKNIEEILSSIPKAAGVEEEQNTGRAATRKTWIAIKLSALLPSAESLRNFSSALVSQQTEAHSPFGTQMLYADQIPEPMSEQDVVELRALHSSLKDIADSAVRHQVRVLVDAEHTWYQPAIDALTNDLMQHSNSTQHASPVNPVIYLTYQAYLRSTPARLRSALAHAASNGYVLGVKLVRGAYHSQEVENHFKDPANKDTPPPVWSEKYETDQCFNECASLLLDKVSRPSTSPGTPVPSTIGVLFGTHNKESCDVVIDELWRRGLTTPDGNGMLNVPESTSAQVQLGQLLGMADELTNYVASRLNCPGAPMVLKCVPYGKLEDVMPYLSRRATENKSVLGNSNTTTERQRISKELKRRVINRAVLWR